VEGKGIAVLAVIGLIVTGSLIWIADSTLFQKKKRDRYLIPDGYAGWLCVVHGVSNGFPLPIEDGYRIVKFPSTGVVETSSEGMPGEGFKDQYYYYSKSGQLRPLDVGKEMGGGYTTTYTERPQLFEVHFWISRDARADYHKFVESVPFSLQKCGPFESYRPQSG